MKWRRWWAIIQFHGKSIGINSIPENVKYKLCAVEMNIFLIFSIFFFALHNTKAAIILIHRKKVGEENERNEERNEMSSINFSYLSARFFLFTHFYCSRFESKQ